jgi:hypothetical protein
MMTVYSKKSPVRSHQLYANLLITESGKLMTLINSEY